MAIKKSQTETYKEIQSISEYQKQLFEESLAADRLNNTIKDVSQSYSNEEKLKFKEYSDLLKKTSVEEIARQRDSIFLHGTLPDRSPNPALENPNLDWGDKIDVLLSVPTTISTSLYNKHGNPQFKEPYFGPVGVVIREGQVLDADFADSGTTKSYRNSLTASPRDLEGVKTRMSYVKKGNEGEFVVRNPKVSAIWIEHKGFPINDEKIAKLQENNLKKIGGVKKLFAKAEELNVPVYALNEGEVYTIAQKGDSYEITGGPIDKDLIRDRPPVYINDASRANKIFTNLLERQIFTEKEKREYEESLKNLRV